MNVSKELLEKAKAATSAEELLELAKAENIELSAEQAAKAFAELNKTGELSDEELDNVSGGCGRDYEPSGETPKFHVVKFLVGKFACFIQFGKRFCRFFCGNLDIFSLCHFKQFFRRFCCFCLFQKFF